MHSKIEEILRLAVANRSSDVHLILGLLPKFRTNGILTEIGSLGVLEDPEIILSVLSGEQRERFFKEKELDFSVTVDEARFRANIYV